MAHTLTVDLSVIVPYLREIPTVRLYSRRIGGAGILEHPIFSGVRTLTFPTDNTIEIPASSEYPLSQEYMLSIGGREYVFVMPDEDATLSNLLLRGSSKLPPALVQETEPLDPLVGQIWIQNSTHRLRYWSGSVWQDIGTAEGATHSELDRIRNIVDDAVQLGSIDVDGRNITFATDGGQTTNVYIPGISVYHGNDLQGTANVVTQLDFVAGQTFGVSVTATRATITIPTGGGLDNAGVDARVALKTDPLETRVDQIEEFEETFRVRTEVTTRQRIVVSRTNTAYELTSTISVPALQSGRDQEIEITIEATGEPAGEAVINLETLLAKGKIVRANTEMNHLNSVLVTDPPDNNRYWIGVDSSGDWFFGSDTTDTYYVTIAITILKDQGLGAGAVRDEVKAQIEAGTDITVTPSGSGPNQKLRVDYTGNHSTPNAVTLDTSEFTNADDGTFPSWNNESTRWDTGQFADTNDIEFDYDKTNAEWSAKPKGKLNEIVDAFQDGGWERVNGTAAQVPFVSDVSYATEPTGITGYTFVIEGRNNTGFSNYQHLVVRMPSDLEYKTTRYRLAIFDNEGNGGSTELQIATINMNDTQRVSLLGTDDDYTYLKVNVLYGLGGQERYRMEVFNEFTFNKAKLDLTSDEISDFIPRTDHIEANDGKDIVYNHAEDSFKFRTTEKLAIANLPVWIGTSAQLAALTREDGIIYLATD